jgi:hypothetical protein
MAEPARCLSLRGSNHGRLATHGAVKRALRTRKRGVKWGGVFRYSGSAERTAGRVDVPGPVRSRRNEPLVLHRQG